MLEAQNKLELEINKIIFNNPKYPIVSNYDATTNTAIKNITDNLKLQMSNRVRWTESIENIEKNGEDEIIEIGPGKVLSGLIKRITNKIDIKTFNNIQDLEQLN